MIRWNVVVEQIPGGVVSERVSGAAHSSLRNIISSQWHCGRLGGWQCILDGRPVPVDRGDSGAACSYRSQDRRLVDRRTASRHRCLASPRVSLLRALFVLFTLQATIHVFWSVVVVYDSCIGSRALSFSGPLLSVDVEFCVCVCVSATLRSNISKTKSARRKVAMGSL